MSEPTTQAGLAMLGRHMAADARRWFQTPKEVSDAILAIEAEAKAQAILRIHEGVAKERRRGWPHDRIPYDRIIAILDDEAAR